MTLEPEIAVTTLERALRLILAHALREAFGAQWLERVTTPEQRARWQVRYEQERTRRPGVPSVPAVGLAYSELHELISIADKHWDKVAPALGKRAAVLPLLEHFERTRNTASHSRDLMPFERQLMSGIAGEIRSKVTAHMSSLDPAGDYYPRMESAADDLGATMEVWDEIGELAGMVPNSTPRSVLHVGDVVTFTCTGTDPKGRDLEWKLVTPNGDERIVIAPSGEPVELEWEVDDKEVGDAAAVNIYMSAAGAKYRRWRWFDHRTFFIYVVRPPDFV